MKLIVDIYRSKKKEGLYLYVEKGQKLEELPEVLLKQFGMPEHSMSFLLTEDKTLARATASEVIQSINEKRFYLQMPPSSFEKDQSIV